MAQVPSNVSRMDYAPFSPTIAAIREAAQARSGQTWNSCHIIYYADGEPTQLPPSSLL